MTISLTLREFLEQYQEADKDELYPDPLDQQDKIRKSSGRLTQGCIRNIRLREGISLWIEKTQIREPVLINAPERENEFKWRFFLSGILLGTYYSLHQETSFPVSSGRYLFSGNGLLNPFSEDCSSREPFVEVCISVQLKMLRSFVSDSSGELPQVFRHLDRPSDNECYKRAGEIPPMVNANLQQIIHCSRQGLTKRMFLEAKVTEIISSMLEEEAEVQQGEFKPSILQSDRLDRIHYAQEILLKNLTDPPSLMELARQVGMCDYNLKRGFKEIFNTTVFDYLRDRRMEKAQQLLLDGQMKVAAIARTVGYDSPTSFNAAFKRKYGASPKAYQLSIRK